MVARTSLIAPLVACCSAQLMPRSYLAEPHHLEDLAEFQPTPDAVPREAFTHPKICDPSVNQTAGYIDAAANTPYFFWLFESKSDPAKDPLIMWLSGGPGCSSQLALLFENGPCKVNEDGVSTSLNPYSWHAAANVMWVDQPAGVGFSGGLGTHNEAGVAKNMFTFLQGFFSEFPRYQHGSFFIFGESYGGHYLPAIAHRIWEGNKAEEGLQIPLAGIAIGNGLTDPEEQYKWYAEMGRTGGRPQGGHAPAGVLSDSAYQKMKKATPACIKAIHTCNSDIFAVNHTACVASMLLCEAVSMGPYESTGLNPYDMRIPCETGGLCYDFSSISGYLNSQEVKDELGAKGNWADCSTAVGALFMAAGDGMVNYHEKIPDLLHEGIKVLVYAGDCDYICNWLGNKAWALKLEWQGADAFVEAEDREWYVGGKEAVASLRSAQGFHFMQIYDAGHMVPTDQPEVALEMVKAFISGTMGGDVTV